MSNFKRMVRERMAKTGEAWSTAARHVRKKAELRKAAQPEAYPIDIKTMLPDHSMNTGPIQPSVSCGACGAVFDSRRELEAHNPRACWESIPCPSCGEVCGLTWDHVANKKICKGCGYRRDIV